MTDSIADQLALAAEQLSLTSERLDSLTVDDAPAVARYLSVLAEHGHLLCHKALTAIEGTPPGHPTRSADHGIDLQAALAHSACLLDAIVHFAWEAERACGRMAEGEVAP